MSAGDESVIPERDGRDLALADLRRSERAVSLVRWVAVAFALGQVLTYDNLPYPAGVKEAALALTGVLAAANAGIWLVHRRTRTYAQARNLAVASLSLDVLVASGFVWLYAFDQGSALWAILFILPLEGAIRFRMAGALGAWAATTALYVGRELWASDRYGYDLEWNSVSFRIGVGLFIALIGGLMARDLTREHARLSAALTEVRRVDAVRSGLISTLAHDVRNPLTTIRGTLKMLLARNERLDPQTAEELIRSADGQAARLERLAIDLLDLARVEHGRLELSLEEIGLKDAVDRAIAYANAGDRVEVRIDPSLSVRADPNRLEQIIVNLLQNALRYGEPPFLVEAALADGRIDMQFRDHGKGVAVEDRTALFEPFRHSDTGTVGFGLAIVKALVEVHGGRVSYEENPPRGACFRIVFPTPDSAR